MADEALRAYPTRLEWQVDRRYLIQQTLIELRAFLEKHKELPDDGDDFWFPIVRMVDVAFSLWRSAFLTDVGRERASVFLHTKEFIHKVLTHNAISFADDFRMCELTVGYYNSNARYRIERMCKFDQDLLQIKAIEDVEKLKDATNLEKRDQQELWDLYYLALRACWQKYKADWEKKARPLRTKPREAPENTEVIIVAGSTTKRPRARRSRRPTRPRRSRAKNTRS